MPVAMVVMIPVVLRQDLMHWEDSSEQQPDKHDPDLQW